MKVYGLTGGVGMGKTTSDKILRDRGIAVVDTDLIARQLVEPGEVALAEIQASFGADIVDADGQLRRNELARLVFTDANALKRLENILHPRIRVIWQKQTEKWRAEGHPQAVVVIPLLFETKAEARFDSIICVACSGATQRRRLAARGWDSDQIEKRIRAQWPIEKKMDLANYVIWTEGDLDAHAAQLERVLPQ